VKKGISPTFVVIAIILVIVIAGLLWYIYSQPPKTPGEAGMVGKNVVKEWRPSTPTAAKEAKMKAAEAEKKLEATEKAGAKKMAPPAKAPAPTKP